MDVRSLGILLLKLWGLLSIVSGAISAISLLLAVAGPMREPGETTIRYVVMSNGLGAVVALLLGLTLLMTAERIVGFITPDETTVVDSSSHTLADIQSLVFGGLGVYFAISALREIGSLVYAIARHPAWDDQGRFMATFESNQEQLVGATVQLVLAVVLLISRRHLAGLWSRLRPMASSSEEPSNTVA